MEILCLLLLFFLVIHFRGFFLMDCITCLEQLNNSGCWFLVFGSFGQVYKVLGLVVLFVIGFQFLRINGYFLGFVNFLYDHKRDLSVLSKGVCSKSDLDVKSSSKIESLMCKVCSKSDLDVKSSSKIESLMCEVLSKGVCSKSDLGVKSSSKIESLMCKLMDECEDNGNKAKSVENDEVDDGSVNDGDCWGKEWYDEDSEFDVLRLRKLIKIERGRADKAFLDLEMERLAAASASEEAMSMILRLQTEKSLIEMEARQYRRLAEEKQLHNQEVIKSLQWLVLKNETERGSMRNQFSSCRQKLKVPMQNDEGDHLENATSPGISISLDVDLSS